MKAEYKVRKTGGDWKQFDPLFYSLTKVDFQLFSFRLNGKVYNNRTEEFEEDYENLKLWLTLKNE